MKVLKELCGLIGVLVLAFVVVLLWGAVLTPSGAGAVSYNASFAGWQTASGLFPDEVSAEWVVPSVTGGGLSEWVGLSGSAGVLQAGSTSGPVYGTNCWWEDYPYNDQQAIPGLRCAPGDTIFADVAQGFYGPTQSRVIVVDVTTGQSSGWLSEYTPDLNWSPVAADLVEWNSSLGPAPSWFSSVQFQSATAIKGGYSGLGGTPMSFSGLNSLGLIAAEDSLASVVHGAGLALGWVVNG